MAQEYRNMKNWIRYFKKFKNFYFTIKIMTTKFSIKMYFFLSGDAVTLAYIFKKYLVKFWLYNQDAFNYSLMIDFKVIHFKKKFNFIAFNLFNKDSPVSQLVEMLIKKKKKKSQWFHHIQK